jgi:hypothetical protein
MEDMRYFDLKELQELLYETCKACAKTLGKNGDSCLFAICSSELMFG